MTITPATKLVDRLTTVGASPGWFVLLHALNLATALTLLHWHYDVLGGAIIGGAFGVISSDLLRGKQRATDTKAPTEGKAP